MKTRSYREFLKGKWVAMCILSFLPFFVTSCGGSDSIGEEPPPPYSESIDEAPPPPDEHAPSQESSPGWQGPNRDDTGHRDLVPQEINADKILAIGDSITAYYKKRNCGYGQSYSDYASIEIDECIQNEAIGGTRLSGGIARILPPIPQQYANAKDVNGPYDVVILTGGGNDLMFECKIKGQSCTESCGDKMEQIVEEMETLVTEIVRDGSDVIMVGYYPINQSRKLSWYNECSSEINSRYQEIADSSSYISFVSTMDLANPDDESDYAEDGLHPSIALTKKIGERVADAL